MLLLQFGLIASASVDILPPLESDSKVHLTSVDYICFPILFLSLIPSMPSLTVAAMHIVYWFVLDSIDCIG
jgi:hypothetical protein